VLFGHVLRNAIGPTLAVVGMAIPLIIGGAVMTEKLFGLPGIAQLALQSAEKGDVPVVLGTLLVTAVIVVAASLVINVLQKALDPLARQGSARRAAR
jgi:peptide/nickel transport system permease protein